MTPLARAAIEYGEQGWAVFPLAPRSKVPAISKAKGGKGCLDATYDIGRIAEWWSETPEANIGIATGDASGIFVVDLDSADAAGRFKAMGDIGKPAVQRTREGWHLTYAWSEDCHGLSISAGKLGKGIDTRGAGGYIVGAPSIHPSGFRYEWKAWRDPEPPPPWLIDACKVKPVKAVPLDRSAFERPDGLASRYGLAVMKTVCERVAAAYPGNQNDALHRAAFTAGGLIAGGECARSFAMQLLTAAGLSMSSADARRPWNDAAVSKVIQESVKRGVAFPIRAGHS